MSCNIKVLHLRQNKENDFKLNAEKWIKNQRDHARKRYFCDPDVKKLGVTRQSLYRCLNGNPTMNRLKEIADILDVSPKNLFGDEKKG